MLNESHPYLFLAIFAAAALLFGLAPLRLAWLWSKLFARAKPGPLKNATYECGLESHSSVPAQFHARYYVYGIIFLIFDVEMLFLLPFAVVFPRLPLGAFLAVMLFVLLVVEGLAWAWAKGVLSWKSEPPAVVLPPPNLDARRP
jgi:NADH:ubiquinone oxidoreductase subunit 3 (subunit A)